MEEAVMLKEDTKSDEIIKSRCTDKEINMRKMRDYLDEVNDPYMDDYDDPYLYALGSATFI